MHKHGPFFLFKGPFTNHPALNSHYSSQSERRLWLAISSRSASLASLTKWRHQDFPSCLRLCNSHPFGKESSPLSPSYKLKLLLHLNSATIKLNCGTIEANRYSIRVPHSVSAMLNTQQEHPLRMTLRSILKGESTIQGNLKLLSLRGVGRRMQQFPVGFWYKLS